MSAPRVSVAVPEHADCLGMALSGTPSRRVRGWRQWPQCAVLQSGSTRKRAERCQVALRARVESSRRMLATSCWRHRDTALPLTRSRPSSTWPDRWAPTRGNVKPARLAPARASPTQGARSKRRETPCRFTELGQQTTMHCTLVFHLINYLLRFKVSFTCATDCTVALQGCACNGWALSNSALYKRARTVFRDPADVWVAASTGQRTC